MMEVVSAPASFDSDATALPAVGMPPPAVLPSTDTEAPSVSMDRVSSTHQPAQTTFATREELLRYVTDFSLSQGYAVVIHKSNVPRGQLWLRCDMGGSSRDPVPPSDAKRKRKNSSRLQNCPFQLYGRRLLNGTWELKAQNPQHTHEPANGTQDLEQHPKARRLTSAQKRLVVELTDLGIRPSIIVDRLKERFPGKPVKVRDIYNARNYIRTERRAGRIPYPECAAEGSDTQARIEATDPSVDPLSAEDQIKNLWANVDTSMAAWTAEKKEAFKDEFRLLVDKYSTSSTDRSEAEASPDEPENDDSQEDDSNGQVAQPVQVNGPVIA